MANLVFPARERGRGATKISITFILAFASLSSGQHENPRFVILETDVLGTGGSLFVQSESGKVHNVKSNISLPGFQSACQDGASMGVVISNSFQAACWLTTKQTEGGNDSPDFLHLENYDVISCKWNDYEKVLKIPRVSLSHSLENFHFKLDPFGNNVYWSHKTSRGIWATSLSTGYTQLLQGVQSTNAVNLVFAIDPLKGYLFGAFHHPNEVHAVKIPNQILLRVDVPSKVNGIALDEKNSKVYFSRFGQFRVASYKEALEGRSALLLNSSRTPFYHNYLQYHDDHLYWLDGDAVSSLYVGDSGSVSTNDSKPEVIKPRSKQFVFAVFDNALGTLENPCEGLHCSHLCIPHEGHSYKCACPDGMKLHRGRHCLDVSLIYRHNQSIQLYEFGDSGQSKQCIQARAGQVEEGNSMFCDVVRKRYSTIVEIDPEGEDWIEQDDACVSQHSLRGGKPETVFCVSKKGTIVASAMDFKRSILFVADWELEPTAGTTYRIKGHRSPTPEGGKLIKRSGSAIMRSLAVNAGLVKLFWIEGDTKIMMSNYEGTDVTVVTAMTGGYPQRLLRSYGRLLWWNEPANSSESKGARIMEYELGSGTVNEVLKGNAGGDFEQLYFSRIRRPKPTATPKCARCCLAKNDVCFCPDESMRSNANCSILQFVIAVRPPGKEETFMQVYGPTTLSLFNYYAPRINLGQSAKSEPPVSSIDIKRVCFTAGTGAVQCINERELIQPFEINPNSSLFMLHRSREVLFWNNGDPGCITMKNLPQNSIFPFKCFPTPNIAARALDPGRRIYFWTNKTRTLNYNILGAEVRGGSVTLDDEFGISGIAIDGVTGAVYVFQGTKIKRIFYTELFKGTNRAVEIHDFDLYPPLEEMRYTWKVHLENFNDFIERKSKTSDPGTKANVTISRANYPNPCENSKCSHFCLPKSPHIHAQSNVAECFCPSDFKLDPDNRTCSAFPTSTTTLMIVLIVLAFLLIISVLVVILIIHRRRNAQLRQIIRDLLKGNKKEAQLATSEADKAMHQPFPAKYILAASDITIDEDKVLGEGQFGKVFRGTYRSMAVAVKTIKPSFSLTVLNDFAKEVKIMAYIGAHPHIVTFYGADMSNVSKGIFKAVLELSPSGSLHSFLRERSTTPSHHGVFAEAPAPSTIPLRTLLSWCYQIASGMDHLVTKNVIHGDLATRNVLVFDGDVVKLSDFGLSRNLYQYATYQKTNLGPLPWKWMAFESLKFYKFSSESDVWAFGITLWEIFAYGEIPYPQYRWDDDFINALLNGLRLNRPLIAPETVYNDIMLPCWELDASKRPKFSQILSRLENISRNFDATHAVHDQATYSNSSVTDFSVRNLDEIALLDSNQYANHYV